MSACCKSLQTNKKHFKTLCELLKLCELVEACPEQAREFYPFKMLFILKYGTTCNNDKVIIKLHSIHLFHKEYPHKIGFKHLN